MLDVMVELLSQGVARLRDRARAVIGCPHPHAPHAEGKVICPDCGDAVVRRWVAARCAHCHTRRASRLLFNVVTPLQNHCTRCGCAEITLEELDDPPFYMLQYAVLLTMSEADYVRSLRHMAKSRAWTSTANDAHAHASPARPQLPALSAGRA